MTHKFFSLLASVLIGTVCWAQPDVNINDTDWTSSSSNGPCGCSTNFNNGSIQNFHDTGGSGASYSANENESITFCPDATGSKVVAVFATNAGYIFDVDPSDTIYVYDGPSNTSPLLEKLNNSISPNGLNIPASWSNTSGCLTIDFVSDATLEGAGWDANISCSNLAQPFTNHMVAYSYGESYGSGDVISDLSPADTGYVDVCLGDSVYFVSTPYFPYEPGGDSAALSGGGYMQSTNHTTTWEFSDGTTVIGDSVLFVPPARNGYFVNMKVEDSYGIFNYLSARVRVSTIPSFETCMALEDTLCLGLTTELIGGVSATDTAGVDPTSSNFPIGGVFGAQTYLPDGSGQNYTTDIAIAGFTPGGTLQNTGDIEKVCIKIEHSYLGDLEMMLECPSGQSINIFNSYSGNGLFPGGFGGGTTFLGGAYDNNTGNIGVCEEYCFSMLPGALPSWNNGYSTIAASGPSNGNMIVPGTYQPEQAFIPAMSGCPVNGTWTLTVRDNIGIDDGYICEWGIYFNDTLNPNTEFYSPLINNEFWYSDPSIIVDNDTTIVIQPSSTGVSSYTFEVEDDFGCSYDTTINVYVTPGPTILGDTSICDDEFQYVGMSTTSGGIWSFTGPGNLLFSDTFALNPFIEVDQFGTYILNFYDNYCQDTLSHQIIFLADPFVEVPPFDTICFGNDITVSISSTLIDSVSYYWYDDNGDLIGNGDSVLILSNQFADGVYNYIVQASNSCNTVDDNFQLIVELCEIPNVITPNGDGNNDYFFTQFANNYSDVNLTIFNRWGRVVYTTDSYANEWNGINSKGKPLADGTYYYVITYNSGNQEISGTVTVLNSK